MTVVKMKSVWPMSNFYLTLEFTNVRILAMGHGCPDEIKTGPNCPSYRERLIYYDKIIIALMYLIFIRDDWTAMIRFNIRIIV